MKKFVALILSLVLSLTLVSAAFAAETYTTNTTQQATTSEDGRNFEKVRMAITKDGHIAAVKTLKSGYSTLQQYEKEEIEKISTVLKSGGILRGKGLIKGALDERNMLSTGSTVTTLSLEVVNLEELQKAVGDGVVLNAVNVMDAASIFHNGHIGHRAIDRPQNLVAKFHQKNGTSINVYYDVFDGAKKLVFDAEAVSTGSTGNGGTTTPPAGNGSNSNGGTDFTISGEANTDFTIGGPPSDTTSSTDHAGWSSDLTSTSSSTSTENSGSNTSSSAGWSSELTGGSNSNAGSTGGWSEALTGGGSSTKSSTGTGFTIDD